MLRRGRGAAADGLRPLLSAVLREIGDGGAVEGTLVRLCEGFERQRPPLRCAVLVPQDGEAHCLPIVGATFPPELQNALTAFAGAVTTPELAALDGSADAPMLAGLRASAEAAGMRIARASALSHGLGATLVFAPLRLPATAGDAGLGLFAELADAVSRSAADRRAAAGSRRVDEWTGLPLRRMFIERLHAEVARSSRTDVFALLLLDLDSFRQVNETLGTAAGDFLLRGVAARLIAAGGDAIAGCRIVALSRFGEDSFACLLVGERKQEQVRVAAAELLRTLSKRYDMAGHDLFATASVGVSLFPWDGEDAPTLLRSAELALHSAKERGRNRVEFYSPATGVIDFDRVHLKTGLSSAIEKGEIEIVYQPKVKADSGEIHGVEALARWRSGKLGVISPGRFIPLAEETGLIVEIGEHVLRTACTQAAAWHDQGFPRLRMAVNVSGVQVQERDFVQMVARVLDATYLRPRTLEIELTETVAMQRVHGTLTKLRDVAALGVRIAIDDFGTGFSSLAYLKTLPIDTLKIDQSFVANIATHAQDAAVVRTVIALGRNLNLETVAEGVETEQQSQLLRDEGCDLLQGYLYGAPMSGEALGRILRDRKGGRLGASA